MEIRPLHKHPNRGNGNRLFLGLILIILGFLFLLQQIGSLSFRNWWALFILIPALGAFSSASSAYFRSNQVTETVRAGVGAGIFFSTLSILFLFNLSWAVWWPLMVLIPGLIAFSNGFTLSDSREADLPLSARLYRPWSGWTGAGVIYLGIGFLAHTLAILDLQSILPTWWAIAILFPTLGGLITALHLTASGESLSAQAISNLAATIAIGSIGAIALLGISWNLLAPIILISAGILFLTGNFRKRA